MTGQLTAPVSTEEAAPARSWYRGDRLTPVLGRFRWRPEWRFPLVAYVAPAGVTVLATTRWFTPGRYVAALDDPPFIRTSLAHEVTSVWSHQGTGAGATGTPMLQLADVVLLRAVALVGLGPVFAQWLLYAVSFGLCAFGAAYLAGAWVRRPVALLAAGLLATFNMYLLVWVPNPLPALAIGVGGLLGGMVARAADGQRIGPVRFAAVTVACSYLAQNPPWLVTAVVVPVFVALASGTTGGFAAVRRAGVFLLRALPWAILFNLWWLVPVGLQLHHAWGAALSPVVSLPDWSWTQGRATIRGVLTLNAYWALPVPALFRFAPAFANGLRLNLLWIPPLLAMAGVALAPRGRRAFGWLLAAAGTGLVLVSTGLRVRHVARVNLWLSQHVPGMWLFRDPASKLSVPLILVYAILTAFAIDRLIVLAPRMAGMSWARRLPAGLPARVPLVAAVGVVLVALGNITPMWTGSVAPVQAHGGYPSARVAVPAGWYRLADAVNAEPGPGKVLVLPVSLDSYNVTTAWGYHGVDNVPSELLTRPTLALLPGGYYTDVPVVRELLVQAQDALLAGDDTRWRGALRALGVGDVVVRHDLRPASFDPPLSADPARLDAALAGMDGVQRAGDFGVAGLYRVPAGSGMVAAGAQLTGVHGPDATAVAALTAGLPDGSVAVTDPDEPVTGFHGQVVDPGTMTFRLATAGSYAFSRDAGDASYQVSADGGHLRLRDADTVAVDGRPLPGRPDSQITLSAADVRATAVDGDFRVLPPGGDVVVAGPGSTITAYGPAAGPGLSGAFQSAPECAGTTGAPTTVDPVRVAVTSGRVCAMAPVAGTAQAAYEVAFTVRTTGGATAHVCLWEDGPARCAPLPAPAAGTAAGPVRYDAVTPVAADAMSARLYLYADAVAGPGGAEFRDVQVTPLRPVGGATVTPAGPPSASVDLAAGRHQITVTRQSPPPATTGSPEFVACINPKTPTDRYPMVGRVWSAPNGDLPIDAPQYDTCRQPEYTVPTVAGATYRFATDYRPIKGVDPTVCLRESSTGRCLYTPTLPGQPRWQHVQVLLRPGADSGGITPWLYAKATFMVPSQVYYRHYGLTRVAPLGVRMTPADPPRTSVGVESSRVSATDYQVRVHGATGRQILVLPESYASGWAPAGAPHGWTFRHVDVDGYANAWVVDGTGDGTFHLVYGPQAWAWWAIAISALGVAVAVLAAVALRVRRRKGRPVPTTDPITSTRET